MTNWSHRNAIALDKMDRLVQGRRVVGKVSGFCYREFETEEEAQRYLERCEIGFKAFCEWIASLYIGESDDD